MTIEDLKKKNIHVLGVSGAEGSAVLEFLADNGIKNITAHDFCDEDKFKESFFSFHDRLNKKEKESAFEKVFRLRQGFGGQGKIKFNYKDTYLDQVEKADLVFVPQSWFRYPQNSVLHQYKGRIEFSNITKLYFQFCKGKIIAVTGTSGKSTTSALVNDVMKRGYKSGKVYFTGNDRENVQVLNDIFEIKENDILVLEVSNRQLMIDLKKSPHIGIITNISPNHMDDHKTFTDYITTKRSLLRYQKKDDFAILNFDNDITKDIGLDIDSTVYFFSRKGRVDRGAYVKFNEITILDGAREKRICSVLDLKIPGPHNIENSLAASLVGYLMGINTKDIREALLGFKGIKSRLELVKEIDGISYIEDSSACNPEGAAVAVSSFRKPMLLIAGGSRKKPYPGEFDRMADSVINSKVKMAFLIGERAETIKQALKNSSIRFQKAGPIIKICDSLEDAVISASKSAKKGDIVIMSPGCESFGMFIDYRDRAKQFKRLVKNLG